MKYHININKPGVQRGTLAQ